MSKPDSVKVAILVFPFASESVFTFAEKISNVVSTTAPNTIIISGGIPTCCGLKDIAHVYDIGIRLHYLKDRTPRLVSIFMWIYKACLVQLRFAFYVYRLRREIDILICTLGIYYLLPIFVARILSKKVISASFGNNTLGSKINYGNNVITAVTSLFARINFTLSDAIIVESFNLLQNDDLMNFRKKLRNGALFIDDLKSFSRIPHIKMDQILIGFIGRLTVEKGILHFLEAIPLIVNKRSEIRFLIIGTGMLDSEVEKAVREYPWGESITWIKWVDHKDIPLYLNQVNLLVMPSLSEGLPNIALEAMACGVPLLATHVGGLSDLIIEGKTGFHLENTSPETIARSVLRIIDDPDLDNLAIEARKLIESQYSLEASSIRYKDVFDSLVGNPTEHN